MARPRHQQGQIIERSGTFYVRYYTNSTEGRRRVTEALCAKDAKHRNTTCLPVKQLRDEHMRKVNSESGARPKTNLRDLTVADFWSETYLPWATENLRASSVHGYKKLWSAHLCPHFKQRTLREYRTHEGSQFLTGLAKKMTRNSLSHIRSLASGIFTHAVNLGHIESNPWHDVRVLAKTRAAAPTKHYKLEEAEDIVTALVDRVDAQALFALAFFEGLRPSEIAGLQWPDFGTEFESVKIERAAWNGIVDATKTQHSQGTLPLIQPAKGVVQLWWVKAGKPKTGYVFPNHKGGPTNLDSFVRNIIKPRLVKAGVEWKGLYSARRGAGTVLTALTGNALAAQQVLRHKSFLTTDRHYIKPSVEAGTAGLKLLEESALSSRQQHEND